MRVPLVVVTGFLGAGKTTLINHLLADRRASPQVGKLGVIVNELGEVGIDGALLGGEATRQIELPGGCVCCVLGDELGTTLVELVERNPELSAIVLETTGVAEPLPIAWAVAREPVARHVRLAAVVTLVDATHFVASRSVSASVDAQVAYADVLLMTKSELAGAPIEATPAEVAARALAPRALIQRGSTVEHAAWLQALLVDPPLVSEVPHPDGQGGEARDAERNQHMREHVHTEDCRHLDSHAAHGIDSVWVAVERAVDLEELEDQLAELPANYVRIKGIVYANDGDAPRWVAVHRVGPRVSSEPLDAGGVREGREGRIVALGPSVDRAALARCVEIATS